MRTLLALLLARAMGPIRGPQAGHRVHLSEGNTCKADVKCSREGSMRERPGLSGLVPPGYAPFALERGTYTRAGVVFGAGACGHTQGHAGPLGEPRALCA